MMSAALSYLVLGPVTFLSPLVLLGLLVLPIIWWILRVTPPQPKKAEFPPLQILADVMTEEETPDSTPPWLLLFRLLLAAIIAIALARPILGGTTNDISRPLALVIDNGWDAAPNWAVTIKDAEKRISKARRDNLEVLLLTTTTPDETAAFGPAQAALDIIKTLSPTALPPQREAAAKVLASVDLSDAKTIWISSGLDFGAAEILGTEVAKSASASRLQPLPTTLPIVPGDVVETGSGFRTIWHNPLATARTIGVTAHDRSGSVITRGELNFIPGKTTAEAEFELPADLRNRISSLRAVGLPSAGTVKLLDDSWGRPLIGVLTTGKDTSSPLLSEPYYAQTALTPHADIFTGTLDTLLPLAPSIIIMPDEARIDDPELTDYVETGGLLIRFAGPKLAKRSDSLLPVLIRQGDRALGGALTWEDPQTLSQFSQESPFFGLNIPNDVLVKQQIMAEPGAQTDAATWARLDDGSPIVTSSVKGLGRIVLFHVTAGPEWSNLPVSGLYVDMLRRILPLANATPAPEQSTIGDWSPDRVLSGYGRLITPSIQTGSLADDVFEQTPLSETHPAGLYKQGSRLRARNVVTEPGALKPIGNVAGVTPMNFDTATDRTLGGLLLSIALIMLAIDVLFSLLASGRMGYLKPNFGKASKVFGLIAALSLIMIVPFDAQAQDTEADNNPEAVSDALGLHLAYVKTGNGQIDDLSDAALQSLSRALTQRTTIEPVGVRGVTPGQDPLVFYPFLYYPLERDAQPLSPEASADINAYMAGGGTVVFDTRDQGDRALTGNLIHPGLAAVTQSLDVPQIGPTPEDHVLTKSFYLIQRYPGRWVDGTVWVDKNRNGTARDGVSSVIIGSNDWAAAWALDDEGQGLITLEDDMPRQREMAMRFGVNLAMYALSGNYKSDQVHAKALVERLGQQQRDIRDLGRSDDGEP
ncbi:DUF4159 domain-containing protein [Fretibacter rubidus]|uniref:DUF4159 domain-containing protein n=1 Tax=Fretibacter rubidus TaxID=570162 RepID=UPI00352AE37F